MRKNGGWHAAPLQGAQGSLGKAGVRHNGGDAAASARAECYVGRDGTTLALISNDEMGGGTTITAFQIVARAALANYSTDDRYAVPSGKRPRCAPSKTVSRSTATGGGLRLGMTQEEVRRLLGTPGKTSADHLTFTSESKVPMTPEDRKAIANAGGSPPEGDSFDRARWVRVEFEHGKAVAIRTSQVTTL